MPPRRHPRARTRSLQLEDKFEGFSDDNDSDDSIANLEVSDEESGAED